MVAELEIGLGELGQKDTVFAIKHPRDIHRMIIAYLGVFCTMAGADERNAPAEVDGVEPEFLAETGVLAEPRLEMAVGGLPVIPAGGGGVDGASLGAEIVNIERF